MDTGRLQVIDIGLQPIPRLGGMKRFRHLPDVVGGLRSELDALCVQARKTRLTRAVVATAGAGFLAIPFGPLRALAWLVALVALDIALQVLAALAPRRGRGRWAGVAAYVLVLFAISIAWSAIPVAFAMTRRLALQMAGTAIVTAQLVDVLSYAVRLYVSPWILGAAPLFLFVFIPLDANLDHAGVMDLSILAFCVVCTVAYFMAALRQNRITAQALEASNTAAQAASRAKSAFVSTISHELRTPMNAVIGLAHALKTTRSAAERDERLDLIIRSGEGLMVILNDLLDLSKVEAGKLSVELLPVDLQAFSREIPHLWSPLAGAKGLFLNIAYDPDTPQWVLADGGRLRQVTGNLVSNAIKFTSDGGVTVRIRHEASPQGRVALAIEVTDTGIGISAEEGRLLFQPFSQTDVSTSRRYGGTGLGLSLSRALLDLMGGALILKPGHGKGATFLVTLSLDPASPPLQAPGTTEEVSVLTGLRVLVVDDNEINLKVASLMLTHFGAHVVTASGGAKAVDMLKSSGFDLVLLDIHMPGMTGQEVLNKIRGGEAGACGVTVVACTADAMREHVTDLLTLGFDGVQSKPMVPGALAATLGAALQARPRATR